MATTDYTSLVLDRIRAAKNAATAAKTVSKSAAAKTATKSTATAKKASTASAVEPEEVETNPIGSEAQIKKFQLAHGIEETGVWDEATKLAYRQDLAAKGAYDDIISLSDLILSTYNLPTTDTNKIRESVEAYLRNPYDQSIASRQRATDEQRAMIDLDAFSRGMGSSTWVTDAKQRLEDEEYSDIVQMEANYQAALAEAVLNQYNAAVAQGLAAKDNAYALAAELYNLGQNVKAGVGGVSVSGGGSGGGGGGYVSTAKKKSSSGSSSSGSSSSGSGNTYDSSRYASSWSNKDVRDEEYAAMGATNYQTKTGSYIGNAAYNAAKSGANKYPTSPSSDSLAGQVMRDQANANKKKTSR